MSGSAWERVKVAGETPFPKFYHSTNLVGQGKLFVFGGKNDVIKASNDFHILNTAGLKAWNIPNCLGTLPNPRFSHSMVLSSDSRDLILFGGCQEEGREPFNDLNIFTAEKFTWSRPRITGEPPLARCAHTAVLATKDLMVVHGGLFIEKPLNDIAVYNVTKRAWLAPPNTTGEPPSARYHHTATLIGKRIFFFGGNDGNIATNSLYILNIDTWSWSNPPTSGTTPPPRYEHSAELVTGKFLIIFGGKGENGLLLDDMYVLDTDRLVWFVGKVPLGVDLGHTPKPRAGHKLVGMGNKLLYLLGGYGGKALTVRSLDFGRLILEENNGKNDLNLQRTISNLRVLVAQASLSSPSSSSSFSTTTSTEVPSSSPSSSSSINSNTTTTSSTSTIPRSSSLSEINTQKLSPTTITFKQSSPSDEDIEKWKSKCEDAERARETIRNELVQIKAKISEVQQLEKLVNDKNIEIERLNAILQTLKSVQSQDSQSKSKIDELNKQISELKAELGNREWLEKKVQKENEELKDKYNTLESTRKSESESAGDCFLEERETLKHKLDDEVKKREELEHKINKLNENTIRFENQESEWKSKYTEQIKRYEELEKAELNYQQQQQTNEAYLKAKYEEEVKKRGELQKEYEGLKQNSEQSLAQEIKKREELELLISNLKIDLTKETQKRIAVEDEFNKFKATNNNNNNNNSTELLSKIEIQQADIQRLEADVQQWINAAEQLENLGQQAVEEVSRELEKITQESKEWQSKYEEQVKLKEAAEHELASSEQKLQQLDTVMRRLMSFTKKPGSDSSS